MATSTAAKKTAVKKVPDKTVAKVDKLPTDLSPAKAKALNEKIKGGVTNVIELLHTAYEGRIWLSLDDADGKPYKDWGAYVQGEFQGAPLQLPTLKRREAVKELTEKGWSTRAISAVTGAAQQTISDDVKLTGNRSVDDGNVIEGEVVHEERTVTGLDGKVRDVKARPKVERQADIVKDAIKLAAKLRGVVDAIDELIGRPDFKGHEVEISQLFTAAFDDLWSTTVDLGLDNPMGNPGEPSNEDPEAEEPVIDFGEQEPEPAV